jgi:hypothetical protein
MTKTAHHQVVKENGPQAMIDALATINLDGLSFIQLHRLQKVLQQVSADVAAEADRRAEADASGDTVKVQSPNL